ncbi:MAG: hypothetical protein IPF79_02315 [Ignavibacteria bacterium]|nr:hypothetical protein [Ignavibacteria bacterium]
MDTLMEGIGFKMGPFELMDAIVVRRQTSTLEVAMGRVLPRTPLHPITLATTVC